MVAQSLNLLPMPKAHKFMNTTPSIVGSANDDIDKWGFTMTDEIGKRFSAIESNVAVAVNEISHVKETLNSQTKHFDTITNAQAKKIDDLHTKTDENHLDLKLQIQKQGTVNAIITWVAAALGTTAFQYAVSILKKMP